MDWVIAKVFIIVSERLDICSYSLRILFKEVWASSNVKHPCLPHMSFFLLLLAIWKAIIGFTSSGSQEAIFLWCTLSIATLSGMFLTLLRTHIIYTLSSSLVQIGGHFLMFQPLFLYCFIVSCTLSSLYCPFRQFKKNLKCEWQKLVMGTGF